VVVQQAPQPGVVLADQLGDGFDRHLGEHRHQQGLKQQREAAFGPRPSKRDLAHAVGRAGDPGHTGVQVGPVLEEVQVPPGLVAGVMHRTGSSVALGAGKPDALGEVQVQVQTLAIGAELGAHHPPGFRQAKSSLEQIDLRHPQSFPIRWEGPSPYRLQATTTHSIQRGAFFPDTEEVAPAAAPPWTACP
jgi:hypothetical protein